MKYYNGNTSTKVPLPTHNVINNPYSELIMDATDTAMSYLIKNTFDKNDDKSTWLAKYAGVLTTSALMRCGFKKAFDSCTNGDVLSIKTEDTGMFGITHNMSIVGTEQTIKFLTFLDSQYNADYVEQFKTVLARKKEDERVVLNVLINVDKLSDDTVKVESNRYVLIDTFSSYDDQHDGDCACCS